MDKISGYKHKINITVRFSDLDAMGHVNNATFLSYLEESRIAYFSDVLKRNFNNLGFGGIVARIEIDYKYQIGLGNKVTVYARCKGIGEKSMDIENIIVVRKADKNITAAYALLKLVTYDYKKKVTIPVPDDVRKTLMEYDKIL